ncbi:glycosyltransferase family 2 protein [Yersinia enterocolitica]|uniref:glycosyltransferase family 2 protein n=1 Tax=Yersinia enterocolitica TaxID=630 RepID=UPI002203D56F|nr:glycosyl transferase family 2 [Yersinia enterocolitica]HDL7912681.1 glycosyltransferase family 2 protein [Yersinia enterocolitica]HDZ9834028.1 glycosyltransferase family 2 protein [Yersinia enterocolitica]HEC1640657.1 glycosyltransferase family 2 protein [Yersinia enterocolitica]HEN3296764.1 glycosyltransferase family 2 protein [Yersinia enterocolitica]
MQHKISVIIPCYNAEKTIISAIESVIDQTYPTFEIICVDDCSTDNTVELIKCKFSNVIVMENRVNSGPAKSRNRGMEAASGDFIAFLDSDDVWYPNKISVQIGYLIDFNLVCIGSPFTINNIEKPNVHNYSFRFLTLRDLCVSNKLPTPSVVIKNMGLMFDDKMRYAEDYDLWLRIAKLYPHRIGLIEQPLVSLGKPDFGVSGLSSHLLKMEKGELQALSNNLGWFGILFQSLSIIKFIRRLLLVYIVRNKYFKKV